MAISMFSINYGIASVASLPRNDIATRSVGKGRQGGDLKVIFKLILQGPLL